MIMEVGAEKVIWCAFLFGITCGVILSWVVRAWWEQVNE